jgi:hypothetical protein
LITLNTIIYDKNYQDLLSLDSWFFKFESKFISKKLITVNNVTNKDEIFNRIDNLRNTIDFEVIYVEDVIDDVIDVFKLKVNRSSACYNYLVPNLSTILRCDTKFLLHISGDCMCDININDEFIQLSILEIENNSNCLNTTLPWVKDNRKMDGNLTVAQLESEKTFEYLNLPKTKVDKFSYTLGFADHLYLGSTNRLKSVDYNIREDDSEFYNGFYKGPDHSGGSFEQRIADFKVKHGVFTGVFEDIQYYIHDNHYF